MAAVLTQVQARDQYLVDSFAQFLDRNLKVAYDAEVALTAGGAHDISKALLITKGKPTDAAVALAPPAIGIEDMPASLPSDPVEIGSASEWRYMRLQLYCYPALRADGYPSDAAAFLLKAYLRDLFSTYSFRVIDYSNPLCTVSNVLFCGVNADIVSHTTPMDRGKTSPNAAEQNRFDIHALIKYPVAGSVYT